MNITAITLVAQSPSLLNYTNTCPSPVIMTSNNSVSGRPKDESWVTQLENAVEENLKHPNFTVDWLCHHMVISRRQLYRKTKSLTGFTPKKYIQEKRLEKALLLLRNRSFKQVKQVAHAVGMKDVEYFSKLFRQKFGHLPSDYI